MKFCSVSILAISMLSIVLTSCEKKMLSGMDNNYRNDIYKTVVSTAGLTDLGILKLDITKSNVALIPKAWNDPNLYTIKKIDNYHAFGTEYGDYKDTVGIDSGFFAGNDIICFSIIEPSAEIQSYTYQVSSDTLILNCRVRIDQERENGYLVPKTLFPYVITFGNTK
jgi:hypothetical protein